MSTASRNMPLQKVTLTNGRKAEIHSMISTLSSQSTYLQEMPYMCTMNKYSQPSLIGTPSIGISSQLGHNFLVDKKGVHQFIFWSYSHPLHNRFF